ncbi:unnamed protein product [Mesocestoides corti]|uniref:Uncharacterized protein n=1 Tax=Mesocestoides corti TaxID=53468 RepID=A0A0R3U2H5_MESCO|nr:unnamed protein product [Mesocestoides corti]
MVLIQPIKSTNQLKLEAADTKKPTLLSIAMRRHETATSDTEPSPLEAIKTRIMEQRKQSSEPAECTSPPASKPMPHAEDEQKPQEDVFEHDGNSPTHHPDDEVDGEMNDKEEKDLIEM